MPWFALHTQEHVHGVYHVEAKDADEAKRMFTEKPEEIGEQQLYEAYSAEVTMVQELKG